MADDPIRYSCDVEPAAQRAELDVATIAEMPTADEGSRLSWPGLVESVRT